MDTILPNTLSGTTPLTPQLPPIPKGLQVPDLSGNAQADINTLQSAQKQPNLLMNFSKVMQATAQQGYKERQVSEMNQASKQFDPTKVSGGTFAGIIQNLEANRGADVSKVYASTMNAYSLAQQQITDRLDALKSLEQDRMQHEEQMSYQKEQLKLLKKQDKDAYKIAKGTYDMKKTDWERSYAKEMAKVKTGFGKAQMYPFWAEYEA